MRLPFLVRWSCEPERIAERYAEHADSARSG